jgi:hypothetical protein
MQENILCEDLSLHPRDCADYCVSATEPTHTHTQRRGKGGDDRERTKRDGKKGPERRAGRDLIIKRHFDGVALDSTWQPVERHDLCVSVREHARVCTIS